VSAAELGRRLDAYAEDASILTGKIAEEGKFTNFWLTLACAPVFLSLGPERSSLNTTVGRRP
jgi:hypothetical protein